jgi:hypothetical protein
MHKKADPEEWVLQALNDLGGEGHLARVAEHIWTHHENDLRRSGDLFFTWQYDMRWAAQNLKDAKKLVKLSKSWRLTR